MRTRATILGMLTLLSAAVFGIDLFLMPTTFMPAVAYMIAVLLAAYFIPRPGWVAAIAVWSLLLQMVSYWTEQPGLSLLPASYIAGLTVVSLLCVLLSKRASREAALRHQAEVERGRAEAARAEAVRERGRLKENEGRLKRSQEISHLGSWELDLLDKTLTWSDEIYRIFGFQPQQFEPSYESFLEVVHPEDRARVEAAYSGLGRDSRESFEIEHRVVRKLTGEVRYVHEKCEHTRDDTGRIIRSAGMVHDITERRRAEEAVRESEERLRYALETSRTGAWDLDLADHTAYRSLGHDRIFGYQELLPEWTYEMFLEHVIEEDREAVAARYGEAIATRGDWSFECRIRRVDGQVRWIWAAGRHRADPTGEVHRMAGIVQDITERKEIEAERERVLAQFEATLASIADGVLVYAPDGSLVSMNRGAELILGYDREHWEHSIEDRVRLFQAQTADGKPLIASEAPVVRALRGETVYNEITRLKRPDGSWVWSATSAAPIRLLDGQPAGSVVTIADVTRLYELQAQMERSLRAEKETRELAERAVKARDEFMSVAAHELKTPVTSLMGFAQVLMWQHRKTGSMSEERVIKAMRVIDEQSRRLARLTEQLLNLSRLETGKLVLVKQETDVAQLVEKTVATIRHSHPTRLIGLTRNGSVMAEVDSDRLEQVITNLLDNAIKFSDGTAPVEMSVSADQSGWAEIAVRDYGIGIPEEKRSHIFEQYYQAHTERHYGGMGIGLFISHQIVEMHGGEIALEQPADGGCKFIVRLPAST